MTGAVRELVIGVSVVVIAAALVYWGRQITMFVISAIAEKVTLGIGNHLQERWRRDLDEKLEPIYEQLRANGGLTIRDKVFDTDRRLRRLERHLGLSEVETGVRDDDWDTPHGEDPPI